MRVISFLFSAHQIKTVNKKRQAIFVAIEITPKQSLHAYNSYNKQYFLPSQPHEYYIHLH